MVLKMKFYEEHINEMAKEMRRRHYKSTDGEKFRKKFGFDKEWTKAVCKKMEELEKKEK